MVTSESCLKLFWHKEQILSLFCLYKLLRFKTFFELSETTSTLSYFTLNLKLGLGNLLKMKKSASLFYKSSRVLSYKNDSGFCF